MRMCFTRASIQPVRQVDGDDASARSIPTRLAELVPGGAFRRAAGAVRVDEMHATDRIVCCVRPHPFAPPAGVAGVREQGHDDLGVVALGGRLLDGTGEKTARVWRGERERTRL